MLVKKALLSFLAIWTASLLTMVNISSGAALAANPFSVTATTIPRAQAAEGDAACQATEARMVSYQREARDQLNALKDRWESLDEDVQTKLLNEYGITQEANPDIWQQAWNALTTISQVARDAVGFVELITQNPILKAILPNTTSADKAVAIINDAKADLENQANTTIRATLVAYQEQLIAYGQQQCDGDQSKTRKFDQHYKTLRDSLAPYFNSFSGKRFFVFEKLDIPKFEVAELTYAELAGAKGDCKVLEAKTRNQLATVQSRLADIRATHYKDSAGSSKPEKVDAASTAIDLATKEWETLAGVHTQLKTADCLDAEQLAALEKDMQATLDDLNQLRKSVDKEANEWGTKFERAATKTVRDLLDLFKCTQCEQGKKAETQDTFELARLTCCFLLEIMTSIVDAFLSVAAFACEAVSEGDAVCAEIEGERVRRGGGTPSAGSGPGSGTETGSSGTSSAEPATGGTGEASDGDGSSTGATGNSGAAKKTDGNKNQAPATGTSSGTTDANATKN